MIRREFVAIALGNLWRMKLRTALTVVGVMVGVGALVSMLSFGFGMQKSMHTEFRRLGLFRTLQVLPGKEIKGVPTHGRTARRDSTATPRLLNAAALDTLAAIGGVSLVYPQQSFEAQVTLGDTTLAGVVQALPTRFIQHRPFGKIVAGRFFAADSAREAVVATSWVKRTRLSADSLVGRSMRVTTPGSAQMLTAIGSRVLARYGVPSSWIERGAKVVGWLLSAGRSNVLQVKIVGIAEVEWGFGFRMGEILLPAGVVRDLDLLPFGDPMELLALSSGTPGSEWPMIIVTIDQERDYAHIKQDIEHLGFATLSFPEQLERLRKNFLVFDAFVALIGFIALFVAALGIANTMIMSILERTREIGILKSLGAEDGEVRALFLAEAAAIGVIGSVAGILLGLGVSRIASVIARAWMVRQDIPAMEMFYLPPWVALAAIAFGTLIAVLAGLYPASRAARIDPVQALRHD